ncbi:MAG: S1 RNA-binding domain-containing protein [Candidatus Diapherotrites archaeon]|nr:S1 RNA-binding domain-containing protein [Candidatus Diapherotrites archaeon]
MEDYPEVGDIVVCKIVKIMDYGVIVELLEYDNIQAFVHISQVASSWIKNIRNFVKEGQIKVGQVIKVDKEKNQIDVSFTKISEAKEKEKLDEFRLFKRQQKLVELIAKEKNSDFDSAWENVAEPLLKKYDNLIEAFESILINGEIEAKLVPEEWREAMIKVIRKNIEIPEREVSLILKLTSYEPNGLEIIKNALLEARKGKENICNISYLGSGKYLVKVKALDYKTAEKEINIIAERAVNYVRKNKGEASIERV